MFSGEYAFAQQNFPCGDIAPLVQKIYAWYGASRVLWASDWPWIERDPTYTAQLTLVEGICLHFLP